MSQSIKEVNAVFQQPWWLDAVAPGSWTEVQVKEGGEISARLPFVIKKQLGTKKITMPQLTQTLGPWLKIPEMQYGKQISEYYDLQQELISLLPEYHYFNQNFSPEITNWLPFFWTGFQQTTKYTYRIEGLGNPEVIWDGFKNNIKSDIKKAQKILTVKNDLSNDIFLNIIELTFKRQNLELPFKRELFFRIEEACTINNAGKKFFAVDENGRIHAVAFIIWDNNSSYYLLGGGDPELRNSGAGSFLIWESLKYLSGKTKIFDFEGSMIRPVERFFRAFGGTQRPYFNITKMSRTWKFGYHLKGIVNSFRPNGD